MWYQIALNKRRTVYVILFLGILFLVFGGALGYLFDGTLESTILGIVVLLIEYIVLIIYTGCASPGVYFKDEFYQCNREANPKIYNIVEEMCTASGLSKVPNIYILDTEIPNAFAFGVSPLKSSVCITKGLLKLLNRDELQGVIAHEISHIINRDCMYLLYAGALVNLIAVSVNAFSGRKVTRSLSKTSFNPVVFAVALIFIILAPLFAQLFYLCLSRKREFLADACAARYTRFPEGLASALEKISSYSVQNEQNFALNNLFIKASCITPLKDRENENDLFSTHPSTKKRIKILKSMASTSFNAYNEAYFRIEGKLIISKKDIEKYR